MKKTWDKEWQQEKTWLKTFLGLYMYRVIRNDLAWKLLSARNKEWVLRANLIPNLERSGYADPENYGGNLTFDLEGQSLTTVPGLLLSEYLEKYQPESLLEIGPGAGLHTRTICEHPSVQHYVGVDINPAFIDFLRPRLEKIKRKKKGFSFELFTGDFKNLDLPKVESVVFVSSVHHIPDRLELFKVTKNSLLDQGTIFAFEPSRYLPRKDLITKSF